MRHLLYGLWAGWTGVLLLSRTELVRFTVKTPPDGILGFCYLNGYPKQQDYFWFGAMVAGGLAGVLLTRILQEYFGRRFRPGIKGFAWGWVGIACSAVALLLALSPGSGQFPAAWLLYLGGIVLPWWEQGWYSAGKEADSDLSEKRKFPRLGYWLVIGLLVSLVWVSDSRLRCRTIDGIHEGTHLLYVQELLDGKRLGIDFKTEYGPLVTLGLYGWMKVAGISIAQERMCFLIMQTMGVAIYLLVFRMAGLGWLATGVGSILLLTESSALGVRYGWADTLRTALAFLAIVLYWRGRKGGGKWLAGSGLCQAAAFLYSPDFGMASAAAVSFMFLRDKMFREKHGSFIQFGKWTGMTLAGMALLSLAIYGAFAPTGLANLLFGGYGGSRLMGHGVRPFPVFELFGNWEPLRQIWLMGLVSTGMLAWSFVSNTSANRRTMAAGAGLFTLLALVPGLARPMGQFLYAVPSCMFLVAVGLDDWRCQGGKKKKQALYFGGFLVAVAGLHIYAVIDPLIMKYTPCEWGRAGERGDANWPERLGGVEPVAIAAEDVILATRTVASLSKKGGFIYVGAPAHAHVCFLAGRSGLPPYPSSIIAATAGQRAQIMDSLREYRPPVALLSKMGIDIPYGVEHKEEVEFIKKNYTLYLKTGTLEIYRLAEK